MPIKTDAYFAEWNHELRMGMFRSIAFYRAKLQGDMNADDRAGMKDLLDLLEEYMAITWPGNDAV